MSTLPSSTLTAVPPVAAGMPATPSYTSPGKTKIIYSFIFKYFKNNSVIRITSIIGANNPAPLVAVAQLAIYHFDYDYNVSSTFNLRFNFGSGLFLY